MTSTLFHGEAACRPDQLGIGVAVVTAEMRMTRDNA